MILDDSIPGRDGVSSPIQPLSRGCSLSGNGHYTMASNASVGTDPDLPWIYPEHEQLLVFQ